MLASDPGPQRDAPSNTCNSLWITLMSVSCSTSSSGGRATDALMDRTTGPLDDRDEVCAYAPDTQ